MSNNECIRLISAIIIIIISVLMRSVHASIYQIYPSLFSVTFPYLRCCEVGGGMTEPNVKKLQTKKKGGEKSSNISSHLSFSLSPLYCVTLCRFEYLLNIPIVYLCSYT